MRTLTVFLCVFVCFCSQAQTVYRVMSYNVENLFDTQKSPDKNDADFQPDGKRYWTKGRYYYKLQQIAKVISAAGEWDTPALIGLCEVENDTVLHDLLKRTPLRKQDYRYCMTTGQDERGINTALLYQRDKFQYISHTEYAIPFRNPHKRSRNLLHVTGRILTKDTLDLFVCHFPSRYGGEKETIQDRQDAAGYLRSICDSIHGIRRTCLLLIMGDFNDNPDDESLVHTLHAMPPESVADRDTVAESKPYLVNLFYHEKGSQKYQDKWSQLDQIIVNRRLLQHLIPESAQTFRSAFLLKDDNVWRGQRPLRTYHGYKYEKGFSDHLPVIADFEF
jgi:endonuclease/exonuclease/phosphatase family metal-dependent hydrolase